MGLKTKTGGKTTVTDKDGHEIECYYKKVVLEDGDKKKEVGHN